MVRKSTIKEAIEILGIFSMFGLSVFAYLAWWLAFHQGGRLVIDVNFAGEMWIEYLLWAVITPLITLSMFYYLKQENRAPRRERTTRGRSDRVAVDGDSVGDD